MPQILTLIILLKLWKKLCNETPCEGKIGLFLKINDHLINRKKKVTSIFPCANLLTRSDILLEWSLLVH